MATPQPRLVILTESSLRCLLGMEELCRKQGIDDKTLRNPSTVVRWIRFHDDDYSRADNIATVLAEVAKGSPTRLLIAFPFVKNSQVAAITGSLTKLKQQGCTISWCGAAATQQTTASPQVICSQLKLEYVALDSFGQQSVSPRVKTLWAAMDLKQRHYAWIDYRMRQLYMLLDDPSSILRDTLAELLHKPTSRVFDLTLPVLPNEQSGASQDSRLDAKQTEKLIERYVDKGYPAIAGRTSVMEKLKADISLLAQTDQNVLILGETGTGKEMAAYFLHELGLNRTAPYLELNCAGLDDAVAESALFGHKKGAFTGASEDQQGFVEAAGGGTLFLDELPELSERIQAKLLRFIQSGEYYQVGSTRKKTASCRIIAGGQPDRIKEKVRSDLYYRLAESIIRMPALRELPAHDRIIIARNRADDLQGERRVERQGYRVVNRPINQGDIDRLWGEIEQQADLIHRHDWPGNVRELFDVVKEVLVRGTPLKEVLERTIAESRSSAKSAEAGPLPALRTVDDLLTVDELCHRYAVQAQELGNRFGLSQQKLTEKLGLGSPNTLKKYLAAAVAQQGTAHSGQTTQP